ncbi:hypothetical protein RE654_05050 [Aeromonas caviae]|uniref:DUF6625 family protein n=1 Tax=Aeromonas caviae TaxID=648 RepID=UPI002868A014|nr:DUF6625 family protein [Aeromonas caviae]WMX35611.1 hypothetical protein RE654_05050 [Aeromonas caviae]
MLNKQNKKTLLIACYFGKLPAWFQAYLDSCSFNINFDFLIITDDADLFIIPKNVKIVVCNFVDYKNKVSLKLDINYSNASPYKLTDLKPFLYYVHEDIVSKYDFWGYTDIDLVYGDLNAFFGESIDSDIDLISTHVDRISGHLAIFNVRNFDNKISPKKIDGWQTLLENKQPLALDEEEFSFVSFWGYRNLYRPLMRRIYKSFDIYKYARFMYGDNFLIKEYYTTPFTMIGWYDGRKIEDHPHSWIFDHGRVFSEDDGFEVPYIHFMNFKKSGWNIIRPLWDGSEKFYRNCVSSNFIISKNGIKSIS